MTIYNHLISFEGLSHSDIGSSWLWHRKSKIWKLLQYCKVYHELAALASYLSQAARLASISSQHRNRLLSCFEPGRSTSAECHDRDQQHIACNPWYTLKKVLGKSPLRRLGTSMNSGHLCPLLLSSETCDENAKCSWTGQRNCQEDLVSWNAYSCVGNSRSHIYVRLRTKVHSLSDDTQVAYVGGELSHMEGYWKECGAWSFLLKNTIANFACA